MHEAAPRAAVFLDRDGVVVAEVGYLGDPDSLVVLSGAAETIRALNREGIPVVLVTNQSGIARGLISEQDFERVQKRLEVLLAEQGAHLDRVYFCPHHPAGVIPTYRIDCPDRKPSAGMLQRAARDLQLDLRASIIVGDKASDLAAGRTVGCSTVLVRTGYGARTEPQCSAAIRPDAIFDSLADSTEWLLTKLTFRRSPPNDSI